MTLYMDARRFFESLTATSKTKKAVAVGLLVLVAGAFAACSAGSDATESGADSLNRVDLPGGPGPNKRLK
jgi:hypothetical protein